MVFQVFFDELSLQNASEVPFDNSVSGLTATDVQDAIDELNTNTDNYIPLVDAFKDIQLV